MLCQNNETDVAIHVHIESRRMQLSEEAGTWQAINVEKGIT